MADPRLRWEPPADDGGGSMLLDPYSDPAAAAALDQQVTSDAPTGGYDSLPSLGDSGIDPDTWQLVEQALGPDMPAAEPARTTQLDMVTGYGRELSAAEQAILDRMSQARSVTTARANPQRATEEQFARMWEGDPRGLPVQQFDKQAALDAFRPSPKQEWETDEEYNARIIQERDDHIARVDNMELAHLVGLEREIQDAATSLDPFALGTPGHMGIADAQLVAEGNVGAATMDRQQQAAGLQLQAARETRHAVADVAAWEEQQRQHAADVLAATEQLRATEAEARAQLASLPISDRRNFFKSMSGGQKLWAMIGALATGWNGSDMIPRMVMQMADQQFEEERARIDRASLVQQSTSRAIDQGMDVYNTIARGVTDQATQKLMYVKLQHEQAMEVVEAEWAAATVPVIKAQLEQTLVNMRSQQAEIEHQIGTRLNQTPRQFISTQTLYPGGPGQRRRDEKNLETIGKRKHEVAMKGLDIVGEMEERGLKREVAEAEARTKAARGEGGYQREAWAFAKEAAPYVAVNASLADVQERFSAQDVPGRGLSAYFWSEEGRALREDIKETMRRQLRSESGAVLGEEEIEDRFDSIYSGMGDSELLTNIERLRKFNARYIHSLKAGISDEGANFYDQNLARRSGISRVSSAVGSTPDDDAAALGGRVVR